MFVNYHSGVILKRTQSLWRIPDVGRNERYCDSNKSLPLRVPSLTCPLCNNIHSICNNAIYQPRRWRVSDPPIALTDKTSFHKLFVLPELPEANLITPCSIRLWRHFSPFHFVLAAVIKVQVLLLTECNFQKEIIVTVSARSNSLLIMSRHVLPHCSSVYSLSE